MNIQITITSSEADLLMDGLYFVKRRGAASK